MSDLLTSDDLKTERATEPPRKWRNWWRAGAPCETGPDNKLVRPGEIGFDDHVWPSREVAEEKARFAVEMGCPDMWLGAFPDGEAP